MATSSARWSRGVLAALLACAPRVAATAEFPLLHLDGFEDCALGFPDADGDGFGGAQGVAHACDPLPAGRLRIGGDCADGNAAIHPAIDEPFPDAAFADENCDGVDGDVDLAVFVAATGSGVASCGSRDLPCSLAAAPAASSNTGRTQWYLATGTYPGAITLAGVGAQRRVFGGYAARYSQRMPVADGVATSIVGTLDPAHGTYAARVDNAALLALADLRLAPGNATSRAADGTGLSSIAALARSGALLFLTRVRLEPGNGMSGAAGTPGAPAAAAAATPSMAGIDGGNGEEFPTACNDSSRGQGGAAGTNACANPVSSRPMAGGAGGRGGTMDTNCNPFSLDFDPRDGEEGSDAAFAAIGFGSGGALGKAGSSNCPNTATAGLSGAVTDGTAGAVMPGFELQGSLIVPREGGDGSLGANGGGGGGGGGGGACDDGTDAYGGGGGGGGAGGCAATAGGDGGQGGGSSVGVLALNSDVSLVDVVARLGTGGDGGAGGLGGAGQAPGPGGLIGLHPGTAPPGKGGDGGRGGHAGAGAGGNGGHAFGVLRLGGALGGTPAVQTGTPGAGGAGGAGAGAALDGDDGQPGLMQAVRVCNFTFAC